MTMKRSKKSREFSSKVHKRKKGARYQTFLMRKKCGEFAEKELLIKASPSIGVTNPITEESIKQEADEDCLKPQEIIIKDEINCYENVAVDEHVSGEDIDPLFTNATSEEMVKTCFVPKCYSNSKEYPNKIFVFGPTNAVDRRRWITAALNDVKAAGRLTSTLRTNLYCCEDHFDLENDVKNWKRCKRLGGSIFLKKGVIPHFFDCQQRMLKPGSLMAESELNGNIELSAHTERPFETNLEWKAMTFTDNQCVEADIHHTSQELQATTVPIIDVAFSTSSIGDTYGKNFPELKSSDKNSIQAVQVQTEKNCSELVFNIENYTCEFTMARIMKNPKLYLGVPEDCIKIIDSVSRHCDISTRDICIVLKKLRLNESFAVLGDDFSLSESSVKSVFCGNIENVFKSVKKLIIKPTSEDLPFLFCLNDSKKFCVVFILEVEIEAPSDPLYQTHTYSPYKKCNTLKYMISTTPDGVVNFVTKGFGGSISDTNIVEKSELLSVLPPGIEIMVHKGFVYIENKLINRNFKCIKFSSDASCEDKKINQIVLERERITRLGNDIELHSRRIREFSFLKPHACIEHCLVPHLDLAVAICCALTNLKPSLVC